MFFSYPDISPYYSGCVDRIYQYKDKLSHLSEFERLDMFVTLQVVLEHQLNTYFRHAFLLFSYPHTGPRAKRIKFIDSFYDKVGFPEKVICFCAIAGVGISNRSVSIEEILQLQQEIRNFLEKRNVLVHGGMLNVAVPIFEDLPSHNLDDIDHMEYIDEMSHDEKSKYCGIMTLPPYTLKYWKNQLEHFELKDLEKHIKSYRNILSSFFSIHKAYFVSCDRAPDSDEAQYAMFPMLKPVIDL